MAESTPSGRGLLEGMVCPGNGMELGDAGASKDRQAAKVGSDDRKRGGIA